MRNDSLTLYFKVCSFHSMLPPINHVDLHLSHRPAEDADPNYERNEKLSSYVAYSDAIIRDKMLTIDHGDAIIM